ncbi:J domain-containing protein [Marinobacter salinisoli]|uniref:J domain-containing protein n=1 Tax=Marinobacter salinisoli TaxID=2769486 RepID=A0ABX7MNV1_9GAMM|nr:J domain-containing protein [Marinobacter salinisoli]QSP93946.1 J domain-containing protein [Marinobacter salinisoli]
MTCWEILGIEPTGDQQRIREAYEQQMKFASGEEASRLESAYREASGQPMPAGSPVHERPEQARNQGPEVSATSGGDEVLSAADEQVVREVIIQVKALLNDPNRARDAAVWKAILCEPPADQTALRRAIGQRLESQLRPLAENGNFAAPVTEFIGNWFGWFSLREVSETQDAHQEEPTDSAPEQTKQAPQMTNFWPAVIGWIVALVVLTSFFGGMGGGG